MDDTPQLASADPGAEDGTVSPSGATTEWVAADRNLWHVGFPPGRLVLRSGSDILDLPKDRWDKDLYVAPHGESLIVRVETFQRAVGFLLSAAQAEPLLRHIAHAPTPQATAPREAPKIEAPLLWPRVSPLAVWALICSSLAFVPFLGIPPAIAATVLLLLHRRKVRGAAAWGHSRLICFVAAALLACGLLVSLLGTWRILELRRATATPSTPAFERFRSDGAPLPNPDRARDPASDAPQGRSKTVRAGVLDEERDWGLIAAALFVVLLSLTVHEAAHAISAWWLGDDFARRLGRVTLNPLAHVDPVGTVLLPMILFLANQGIFGWAKPVPVRLDYVARPRRAHVLIALAGPGSNLLIAAVSLMLLLGIGGALARVAPGARLDNLVEPNFRAGVAADGFLLAPLVGPLCTILRLSFLTNVLLAFFNLIPIPPLDGSWILENLFPSSLGPIYQRIRPASFLLFLGLLYTDVLPHLLIPAWYVVDFGLAVLAIGTGY